MEKSFLIVWLEGPMQAYGAQSRMYRRQSLPFPTRGMLWGMVFNAAGWTGPQRERLALLRDCPVTVYCYREPVTISDYQIVGGNWDPSDPWQERMLPHRSDGKPVTGTVPTRPVVKDYLQDGCFSAVLAFPREWNASITAACRSPADALSLGRRACLPTVPMLQGTADSLEGAQALLQSVERARSETFGKVSRRAAFIETEPTRAHWFVHDLPLAFRPDYAYDWYGVAREDL